MIDPPTLTGAKGLTCRRHEWVHRFTNTYPILTSPPEYQCERCGKVRDEARSRQGRTSRNRGNSYERELAAKLGGKRTGMYGGPDDVMVSGMFAIQSKVGVRFPGWMWDELQKLRGSGLLPLLIVADAPGPGHRRRAVVVVELDDWVDLHGPVT